MDGDGPNKLHLLLAAIDQVSSSAFNDCSCNCLDDPRTRLEAEDLDPMPLQYAGTPQYETQTSGLGQDLRQVDAEAMFTKRAQHIQELVRRSAHRIMWQKELNPSQSNNPNPRLRKTNPFKNASRKDIPARRTRQRVTHSDDEERSANVQPRSCEVSEQRELKFKPVIVLNKYACSECDYRFFDNNLLSRHVKFMHGESNEKWSCEECQAVFRNRPNLIRHTVVHKRGNGTGQPDENGQTCTICSAWFNTSRSMANHMRSHNPKPERFKAPMRRGRKRGDMSFQCNFEACDYANTQRCNTERHFEVVHLGLRPYACTEPGCNYKGGTSTNLKTHVDRKHRKQGV